MSRIAIFCPGSKLASSSGSGMDFNWISMRHFRRSQSREMTSSREEMKPEVNKNPWA